MENSSCCIFIYLGENELGFSVKLIWVIEFKVLCSANDSQKNTIRNFQVGFLLPRSLYVNLSILEVLLNR